MNQSLEQKKNQKQRKAYKSIYKLAYHCLIAAGLKQYTRFNIHNVIIFN